MIWENKEYTLVSYSTFIIFFKMTIYSKDILYQVKFIY